MPQNYQNRPNVTKLKVQLVGGWTNPIEKNMSQLGNLPQFSGWTFLKKWNHQLVTGIFFKYQSCWCRLLESFYLFFSGKRMKGIQRTCYQCQRRKWNTTKLPHTLLIHVFQDLIFLYKISAGVKFVKKVASFKIVPLKILHMRVLKKTHHTVDGQNPAPPGMYKTL